MAVNLDRPWSFDTARAFDAVAGEYDRTNTDNPVLRHMRQRALAVLGRYAGAGADLLDVGCGPGTDHRAMVEAGYRVTAIDVSPEMVREAQRQADAVGGPHRPTILCRPIEQLANFPSASFDAAFSNFGPLNCVPDLQDAALQLHDVLRPGGYLVASVIGRVCPWEIALYLSKGDVRRAFTRFRGGLVGVPLKAETVWTQYFTPGRFEARFGRAGFTRRDLRGMGVIAPPPYLDAFARRRPRLVARLLDADDAIGAWPVFRSVGDHFLIVMQRD